MSDDIDLEVYEEVDESPLLIVLKKAHDTFIASTSPPNWNIGIQFKNMDPTLVVAIAHHHPLQQEGNVPLELVFSVAETQFSHLPPAQSLEIKKLLQEKYFKMLYEKEPISQSKVADLLIEYGQKFSQEQKLFAQIESGEDSKFPYWSGGQYVDVTHGLWLCTPCLIMLYGEDFPVVIAREAGLMQYGRRLMFGCSICGPSEYNSKGYRIDDGLQLSA